MCLELFVTARENPSFIKQFLALLNFCLSEYVQLMGKFWYVTEGDIDYLASLAEDDETHALKHTTYSLKSFQHSSSLGEDTLRELRVSRSKPTS